MSTIRPQSHPANTLVAALLIGFLITGVYRCNIVAQCSNACEGLAGYDVGGLDSCRCVETTP